MGIFGKTTDPKGSDVPARPASAPAPSNAPVPGVAAAPPPKSTSSTCVIGAKTVVKGEITGDEDVIVEGQIEGEIRISRDLRVGVGGLVKATVDAQSVIVSGEVVGDCSAAQRVEIQASGRLTGNIRAPRIVIAEGALFKGNSDMSPRKEDSKGRPAGA